ncbi:MAG: hypothetical protein A2Y23_07100 [Clostridiales bacterium GWB2_37_7]|nr:MAG: hypothetical protein A2Y23_07100 [Clostridiales bacterium GWB2_37_7]
MESKEQIETLIQMLNKFISREDCSMEIAGKIEVALDELFPDDDDIQDFITCFASYRPGGGEYLYDENSMIKECKTLLDIIQSKKY